MGYITNFTGQLDIEPPIAWPDVKDSANLPDRAGDKGLDLKFVLDEQTVDTDEGVFVRRTAVAVEPTWEDEMRGYEIVAQLQRLVDTFPGHTFVGYISAEGEESGDLWRLQVVDGVATKVHPRITWPDGTEEPRR